MMQDNSSNPLTQPAASPPRVALVTGASRGIGLAIAIRLARSGMKVALAARDLELLHREVERIKDADGQAMFVCMDVTREKDTIRACREVTEAFGPVEVLVNCAGRFQAQSVAGHPTELWRDILEVNLNGAFYLSREVLPGMLARGWGRIINISSISGRTGEIHAAAYSASKFGLVGLTQSLALEVAHKGITVNAVCPGWVDTAMSRAQLADETWCKLTSADSQDSYETAKLSVPQMRFVEPEEVATLVAYLASDAARPITGQAINICGGMCLT